MFTLPNPLHPVIVHFPIALILVGAAAAAVSVILNRWHLSWFAAMLLALGSIGTFVASQTGETAEDTAGKLPAAADALLETHEEWAERTEATSAVAALFVAASASVGAIALRRKAGESRDDTAAQVTTHPARLPKFSFALRAVAALAGLAACYCIYQTGHAGGKLVYEHGVGVKTTAPKQGESAPRARGEPD